MRITDADIRKASILIVDDQEINISLLTQVLGEDGYTAVTSTTDPREVSSLHRSHDYDLILLDLHMPDMDGFAVIDGLKAGAADGYLPVIVVTAQPAHKQRALGIGARDFVSKPFDLLEVKTRIRNMLEVRLLYRVLAAHNRDLERKVEERTAQLRDSEERFRALAELASDWYWELDAEGEFTRVSGPLPASLGIRNAFEAETGEALAAEGWNTTQRGQLRAAIAARQPFIDLAISRVDPHGGQQSFRVSGEPMFDRNSRYVGYRGVGVEVDVGNGPR